MGDQRSPLAFTAKLSGRASSRVRPTAKSLTLFRRNCLTSVIGTERKDPLDFQDLGNTL